MLVLTRKLGEVVKIDMNDIKNKILKFHRQLESDNNHRYKSWEH